MTFYTAGITQPITRVVIMPTTITIQIIRAKVMAVATTMTSLVKNGGKFGKRSKN